ncbi:MAG: hypothetical protein K2F66_02760 [Duncaniella sp.]|nr:hypothetical protein [Duncaniella sp.]
MKLTFRMWLCALMLGGAAVAVMADSKIVTTVGGSPETRELVRITFDGDDVILNFSDNTTLSADMAEVAVTLTHDEQTAIDQIIADPVKKSWVYNLKGQRVADTPEGLKAGIYIVNGQKVLVK